MSQFKKLISLALAVIMIVGVLPLSIFADDAENVVHTVKFSLNYAGAKTIASQKVVDGECAVEPENAERTGWVLKGWYDKKNGGEKYDFAAPVTEDITLYAQWDEDISYWGAVWSGNILNAIENAAEDREDTEDKETDPIEKYTVTFDANGEDVENLPETQEVQKGETAYEPFEPERAGYEFIGWCTSADGMEYYDFDKSVNKNITVYAKWFDLTDNNTDSDGDGLSDYAEIVILGGFTDPNKADTDEDGISDADEDSDGDGYTNAKEIDMGTDPLSIDTDNDGLTDQDEIETYNTDPTNPDSDGDGASDGYEVEHGTNPLEKNDSFDVTVTSADDGEKDSVKASVTIQGLSGEQVETLTVKRVINDLLFPTDMPGYLGSAYDFSIEGTFEKAILRFSFDADKLKEGSTPVIYYFNETEQVLEPLETTVEGNVASAETTHFSTYILLDRTVYESSLSWEDVWNIDETYDGVEIVFIIDDSGSMGWNDASNQRLTVAKDLITNLPKDSKIGVVMFASRTTILTDSLTADKNTASSYLTTEYFRSSGGTRMYTAINDSFKLFESTDAKTLKMMVVLSDGDTVDTSLHSSVIAAATSQNIKIFTVGLGNSTNYFNNYLKPLAENTGAKFYLASNASELTDIYKDIGKKIDITTDSDGDGISDYYEDNMIAFNGSKLALDKNNPDTDGDGKLDGEEVVLTYTYNEDRTQVRVTGKIISDPCKADFDKNALIIQRLQNTSNNYVKGKRTTVVEMARTLLNEGYEISFIAGILGNIVSEGSAGRFESSKYGNPSKEPAYLKYMDANYDYRNKYSYKLVYKGISLSELHSMLLELKAGGFKGKFGLGAVQWTGGRTLTLVNIYREVAGSSDTITLSQTLKAEALMISRELRNKYNYVYKSWKKNNAGNLDSADAAYNAGSDICIKYEVPNDRYNKAVKRGNIAKSIYNVMIGK